MPLIPYLLKLSISLSLVYLFYQLLLRRLTFYNNNRWYLLGYSLLSFVIPFINIAPFVENRNFSGAAVIRYIPAIENYTVTAGTLQQAARGHTLDSSDIILIVFLAGLFLMLGRLLIQFASLQRIKRKAVVINDADTVIYQVDENIIPFSFGNAIYVNKNQHSEKELEEIILHEYVHVKQRHTIDILVAEWLCIVNWYNPFAWLIRHAIRQNLEFIADNDVLKSGLDKKTYQYHLLKVVGATQYRIANSFNFSSLKKRIAMMNTLKSAKLHLVRFLFILPLIAVLLVAFRNKYEGIFKGHNGTVIINDVGIIIDISSKQPIAGVAVIDTVSGLSATTDGNGFYAMKIPVKGDTGSIYLKFIKKGYQDDFRGYTFPVSRMRSHGRIDVIGLVPPTVSPVTFLGVPSFHAYPDNPGYEDALRELQSAKRQSDDVELIMKLKKDHPEVSMFYTNEDKKKHIVIFQNGQVEKYGYRGSPAVADMEKKYGRLPDMWTDDTQGAGGKDYLAKWGLISAEAEKKFKTSNPDVYAIIFPGDSRVIAVPKNDKPRMYDMDNAAPEERPAFEKLYGSLTGIVPPASNDSRYKSSGSKTDTTKPTPLVIDGRKVTSVSLHRDDPMDDVHKDFFKKNPAVQLLHWGIEKNELDIYLAHNKIEKYDLQKDRQKVIAKYGSFPLPTAGSYGLGASPQMAKENSSANNVDIFANTDSSVGGYHSYQSLFSVKKTSPLIILDGKELPWRADINTIIDPNLIESINVLKGSSAVESYGEKGNNGVIIIKTKKPGNQGNNKLTDTTYKNKISVQNGMMGRQINGHPLYLVDGKVVGEDPHLVISQLWH